MADVATAAQVSPLGIEQGLIVEAGIEIFKPIANKGFSYIRSFFVGQRILVVGPSRAGKTSLADFMRFGGLDPERPSPVSDADDVFVRFWLQLPGRRQLQLEIREIRAVPGTRRANFHAGVIAQRKPDIVIVVLDGAAPSESLEWLQDFCKAAQAVAADHKRRADMQRVKDILVLVNKHDRCEKPDQLHSSVRDVLKQELDHVFGIEGRKAAVLPTILIKHPRAAGMADEFLQTVAKRTARRRSGLD